MNEIVSGFIFDLDGTLVDSGLNFEAMRQEMGLPSSIPILEEIDRMNGERARHCREILDRHEREGAERATLVPGALKFLGRLDRLKIKRALVTRNSRAMAELTLKRCGLEFELIITREDGPAKPDPWAIDAICKTWKLEPSRVVMLGDFRFDMEAGKAAGTQTVYFSRGRTRESLTGLADADYFLESFDCCEELLNALGLLEPRIRT